MTGELVNSGAVFAVVSVTVITNVSESASAGTPSSVAMILGRLEIFPLLVLVTRAFWQK